MTGAVVGSRSDTGWITSASIQQAGAIAIAGINTVAAIRIADKQFDIAERHWRIARELHDYWANSFKPVEITTLNEAKNTPIRTPQYDEQAGRFATSVKNQFALAYRRLNECSSKFCTGARAVSLRDLAIAEAKSTADAINYAYRYEEAYTDSRNDVRWSRIQTMLGLGRNLFTPAASHAASAGNAYQNLSSQVGSSVSDSFEALTHAFVRDRKDPPQYKTQSNLLSTTKGEQSFPYMTPGINSHAVQIGQQGYGLDNFKGFQQDNSFNRDSLINDPGDQSGMWSDLIGSGVSG